METVAQSVTAVGIVSESARQMSREGLMKSFLVTTWVNSNVIFEIPYNAGVLYLSMSEISYVDNQPKEVRIVLKSGHTILLTKSAICDDFILDYREALGLNPETDEDED